MFIDDISERISKSLPELKTVLKQAGLKGEPQLFVKKTLVSAIYMSVGVNILFLFAFLKLGISPLFLLISLLIITPIMFAYLIKTPVVYIQKRRKEINKEIIFAGRALLIELDSGISLFNSLVSISRGYGLVGEEFKKIVTQIKMGTHIEDAIDKVIETTPSDNLRRLLWQILNSLKTGSNVARSIEEVLEQIAKEQIIEVEAYGKKLNPLAMFYMMMAVIVPSLGITMLVVLASLISFNMTLPMLIGLAVFVGLFQAMFIVMIKSMRPAIEL